MAVPPGLDGRMGGRPHAHRLQLLSTAARLRLWSHPPASSHTCASSLQEHGSASGRITCLRPLQDKARLDGLNSRNRALKAEEEVKVLRADRVTIVAGVEERCKAAVASVEKKHEIEMAALMKELKAVTSERDNVVVERDAAFVRAINAVTDATTKAEAIILQERGLREKAELVSKDATRTAALAHEQLQGIRAEMKSLEIKLKNAVDEIHWVKKSENSIVFHVKALSEELGVEGFPMDVFAAQVKGKLAALRNNIRGALHFGVQLAFSVFATHYKLGEEELRFQQDGYCDGYKAADIDEVRQRTDGAASVLATKFEGSVPSD